MDFIDVAKILTSIDYTFAKSMPKNPHWYTLKKNWEHKDLFEYIVDYIRGYGHIEFFSKKSYQKIYINEYKYWTMGSPISETILINKAKRELPYPYWYDKVLYDDIANDYVKLFQDNESKLEEKELFSILDIKGRVLDIGCGAGLFFDHVKPKEYVGIDISKNLLEHLKNKYPKYKEYVYNIAFEHYYGGMFDTIVCLFGSASYIDPIALKRVPTMLNPGGKAYLMYYKEDYKPITHKKCNIMPKVYNTSFDGTIFNGKYRLVKYENISKR